MNCNGSSNYIYANDLATWNGLEYGSGGTGEDIQVYGSASNNIISKNYFHDGYVNLGLMETSGAGNNQVINNIFNSPHVNGVYVGTGGTTASSDLISNNIFIHHPTAGTPSGSVGHALVFSAIGVHGAEVTHANVKNNLFVGETSGAEMVSIDSGLLLYISGQMNQIDMDYNYYWQRNTGATWRRFNNTGADTTDFTIWKTDQVAANVTGANAHSINILSIGSSPFVNIDSNNFNSQPLSPAIDSGTASVLTSTTTDYLNHPLYGLPDMGAYEYQPPFTIGTSLVDPTGNIRIYGDKMYRYTTATSSTMHANFSVAPAETWTYAASTTRPEWLNISNMTWNISDSYTKQWTASSTTATTTVYTIGDLLPNKIYTFKLDGLASTTAIADNTQCTSGICTADGSGVISFTYQGGYSTHTFALEDITAPSSSASASGATYSNIQSVSLTCSDSSSGCDKICYTTNGSTPTTSSSIYSSPITINSGYTTLKFFATDLAGNSEAVHTENYTIITGSVSIFSAPAQTQTPTPIPATTDNIKSPLPPLLKRENTNPPNPLYQGGKIATVEMMLSEALRLVQGRPTEILTNFITNGTPSTLILGSGERSGVVNSFTSAFGRAPQSETDWSDVIKIANGRWPSQRNEETEINAAAAFKKIYKRNADRNNPHDDAAVTIISYGLRPANRNLNSERAAIKSFMAVYGHAPKSAMAWDIVRAIAYSGARR